MTNEKGTTVTPDERAARLHLTAAADALRTASERLCDWLEATGQDVAGNGHVASADEAAGSFREAPTAPVSSSPPPIPLGAVVTVTVNGVEWQRQDGEWDDAEGGGPPNKADALDFLDRIAADAQRIAELEREAQAACDDAAAQKMANVDLANRLQDIERERDEAQGQADAWCAVFDALKTVRPEFTKVGMSGEDSAVRAIHELAREREEARRALAEKEQQMADALAPFGYEFMDPPDGGDVPFGVQIARMGSALVEARRALAADRKSGERLDASALSDPAPLSGAGNTGEIGKARRWWLVVDDSGDLFAYSREHHARNVWGNLAQIVPVVEARVTRETVEEIAATLTSALDITPSRSIGRTVARLVAKRIGLTVEE